MAQGVAAPPPEVADPITRAARELGVDPALAFAIAYHESGYNPTAIGDNGHSVGLFQLNDQGEGAGMTVAEREDPYTNARIALTEVAAVAQAHPDWSPGHIAAAAQRPANAGAYANAVDSIFYSLLGVVPSSSGASGGSTLAYHTGGGSTQVGLFDKGLVGALFNALGGDSPFSFDPTGGAGSSGTGPLGLETFKGAARDAIQIAAGGLLVWFGIETIIAELTGSAVTKVGKRMYGRAAPYSPANREAARQYEQYQAEKADPDSFRNRPTPRPGRSIEANPQPRRHRKGMEGLRATRSGRTTLITREDSF